MKYYLIIEAKQQLFLVDNYVISSISIVSSKAETQSGLQR